MHTFHTSSVPTGCVTDRLSSGSDGNVEPSQSVTKGAEWREQHVDKTFSMQPFLNLTVLVGSGTDILHYNWEFGKGVTCQARRWLDNSVANTAQHFAWTLVIYSVPFLRALSQVSVFWYFVYGVFINDNCSSLNHSKYFYFLISKLLVP
jgi:hypothetical protein